MPTEYGGLRGLGLASLGIPGQGEYLAHYYRLSGRNDPARPAQPFHWGFALLRFAVIFEGIAARAQRGTAVANNAADIGALGVALGRRGVKTIDSPFSQF